MKAVLFLTVVLVIVTIFCGTKRVINSLSSYDVTPGARITYATLR